MLVTPKTIDDLLRLPSVNLKHRKKLPYKSGVYFVMSDGVELEYIGKSINIKNRWQKHHHYDHFVDRANFVRIHWLEYRDLEKLKKLESTLIHRFNPPLNGENNLSSRRQSFYKLCLENGRCIPGALEIEILEWLLEKHCQNANYGTDSYAWLNEEALMRRIARTDLARKAAKESLIYLVTLQLVKVDIEQEGNSLKYRIAMADEMSKEEWKCWMDELPESEDEMPWMYDLDASRTAWGTYR